MAPLVVLVLGLLALLGAAHAQHERLDAWYHQDDDRGLPREAFERPEECPEYETNRLRCYTYWRSIAEEREKLGPDELPPDQLRALLQQGSSYVLYRGGSARPRTQGPRGRPNILQGAPRRPAAGAARPLSAAARPPSLGPNRRPRALKRRRLVRGALYDILI